MYRAMKMLSVGSAAMLLVSLTACQRGSEHHERAAPSAPVPALDVAAPPLAAGEADRSTSVMVYIKLVIEKKYGVLARVFGGKRDNTSEDPPYDAANPWWNNPVVVYADPPMPDADVIGGADARAITGRGASGNVAIRLTLVPHADVSVKMDPRSDGFKGKITTAITTVSEYYDGDWVEMVREEDRQITFNFDTCDPSRRLEVVGRETRTIPLFVLERYTRDQEKWEPRSNWPKQPKSGDWNVVIYGRNATLEVTAYRYVEQSADEAPR